MTSDVAELPALAPEELDRYGRHLTLAQVGLEGQRRLKAARVLLVGAGGLGSPAALYLAAAGVGTITVVDHDVVELSNLQRQIVHRTSDVGRLKVESARERLAEVNPNVQVEALAERFTAGNARALVARHDLVLDGSDNFATRYLVNDACVLEGRLDVYASVVRFDGQASVFAAVNGPCYRCLFPEPPPPELVPDCAEAGVLGVLPGLMGVMQATEALKLLLGIGEPLIGRLLIVNALLMEPRTIAIRRDPMCAACGARTITNVTDTDLYCAASTAPPDVPEIAPRDLAARLDSGEDLLLLDVREPHEWQVTHLRQARLAPLSTLDQLLPALDPERETVVLCKSGVRSAAAVRRLQSAGFLRASSLSGGIMRWRDDVDPTMPRY